MCCKDGKFSMLLWTSCPRMGHWHDASSYVPGWDCHGLPIENKALKETGVWQLTFYISSIHSPDFRTVGPFSYPSCGNQTCSKINGSTWNIFSERAIPILRNHGRLGFKREDLSDFWYVDITLRNSCALPTFFKTVIMSFVSYAYSKKCLRKVCSFPIPFPPSHRYYRPNISAT